MITVKSSTGLSFDNVFDGAPGDADSVGCVGEPGGVVDMVATAATFLALEFMIAVACRACRGGIPYRAQGLRGRSKLRSPDATLSPR